MARRDRSTGPQNRRVTALLDRLAELLLRLPADRGKAFGDYLDAEGEKEQATTETEALVDRRENQSDDSRT